MRHRRPVTCASVAPVRESGPVSTPTPPPRPAAGGDADLTTAKQQWRRRLLDRRRSLPDADRVAARLANADHLTAEVPAGSTVCAFLPLPSEPLDPVLLDVLADRGVRVLVPVVTGAAPLDWTDWSAARLTDGSAPQVRPGPVGIAELDAPRLGPAAVATADRVLVPALAVDRHGFRLGRGGGHYDRTLALLATLTDRRPPTVGVLYDDELVESVPHDDLDLPVDLVVTPGGGVTGSGRRH